jgi:hypothetical protein
MSHYEFYFWQSDDSSNWSIANLQYLYDVPHSFVVDERAFNEVYEELQ